MRRCHPRGEKATKKEMVSYIHCLDPSKVALMAGAFLVRRFPTTFTELSPTRSILHTLSLRRSMSMRGSMSGPVPRVRIGVGVAVEALAASGQICPRRGEDRGTEHGGRLGAADGGTPVSSALINRIFLKLGKVKKNLRCGVQWKLLSSGP